MRKQAVLFPQIGRVKLVSPKIFGHRGASAAAPENTLAAFRLAAEQGVDGVELDVRRTADGVLVVHHDPQLAEGGRRIADLDAASLPSWLPRFHDVLSLGAELGLDLNVEIKNLPDEPDFDRDEDISAAVAHAVSGYQRDLIVSSFNPAALDRVRAESSVATGLLTLPVWDQHEALARALKAGHSALHPHHLSVNVELCSAAHAAGVAVNTWTVDDPERMVWLAECGVDAIITNVPDVAVAALKRG